MRKLLILFTLACFTQTTHSQVIIGLLFGDKLNQGPIEFGINVIGNNSKSTLDNGGQLRQKLGFGLYMDYNIDEHFAMAGSFFFASPKGETKFDGRDPLYDSSQFNPTTERILNYFELPIMLIYRPIPQIGIGAGGYISYLHHARDYYYAEANGGELTYSRSILGELNRIDYGLQLALNYHFKGEPGSQIRLVYMRGLNSLFADTDLPESSTDNFQIGVLIPIKFGLSSINDNEEKE